MYVLTADRFDQVVERHDNGAPRKIVKRYRGDAVDGLSAKDVERLLRAGAIAEAGGAASSVAAPVAASPVSSTAVTSGRPKLTAPKQAWIDYAVSKGLDASEAAEMSKQDLIEALN